MKRKCVDEGKHSLQTEKASSVTIVTHSLMETTKAALITLQGQTKTAVGGKMQRFVQTFIKLTIFFRGIG
jgi:hypothetical protein